MLARIASRALAQPMRAGEFTQRRVAERWQVFIFDRGDSRFAVHNTARRYIDEERLKSAQPRDPRIVQAVHDHAAWLSVDLLSDISADEAAEARRALGKLAAALAMSDCLAVYSPTLGQVRLYDEALRAQFESDEPMRAFVAR